MWPTWVRRWTRLRRRWRPAAWQWSWNGRGSGSTKPPPGGASPGCPRPTATTRAGCTTGRRNGVESGQPWDAYLRSWEQAEGLHAGQAILDGLDARLDSRFATYGPLFFPDLDGISEADEQAAIDRGLIQANRIQYAGRRSEPSVLTVADGGRPSYRPPGRPAAAARIADATIGSSRLLWAPRQ